MDLAIARANHEGLTGRENWRGFDVPDLPTEANETHSGCFGAASNEPEVYSGCFGGQTEQGSKGFTLQLLPSYSKTLLRNLEEGGKLR